MQISLAKFVQQVTADYFFIHYYRPFFKVYIIKMFLFITITTIHYYHI